MSKAFETVDREWAAVATSRTMVHALGRWGSEDCHLRPFSTFAELRATTAANRTAPGTADGPLAALVGLAQRGDDLARQTLVALLGPGLKSLIRQYRFAFEVVGGSAEAVEECAQEALAAFLSCIRSYPLARRPARVAANLLADTRHLILRRVNELLADQRFEQARVGCSVEELVSEPDQPRNEASAEQQLEDLLADAIARRVISAANAELVALTRLEGVSVRDVAAARGLAPMHVYQRRFRAERSLSRTAA